MAPRRPLLSKVQRWIGLARASTVLLAVVVGYTLLGLVFGALYYAFGLCESSSNAGISAGPAESIYFSFVTQSTLGYGDFHPVGAGGYLLVTTQTIAGLVFFAVASAIMVFKILQPPQAFGVDPLAVFYPVEGVLRFRVYCKFPTPAVNVKLGCYFRTWRRDLKQPAFWSYDVPMVRTLVPMMSPEEPWLFDTIASPHDASSKPVDNQVLIVPDHLRAGNDLILVLNGRIDELKSEIFGHHTYAIENIVCGEYKLIDPEGEGHLQHHKREWNNLGKYQPTQLATCASCRFRDACALEPRRSQLAAERVPSAVAAILSPNPPQL